MSDRAVDDLNARLVQQRTAFEDKQVNTRTIPAFLALSLFKLKIIAFVIALLTVCPHQRDATSSTIADDLDIKCRELEDLDRNLQRLRSEQDRAAAAGESALRLRLKREELFSAEVRPRDFKSLTSPSTHTRSRITRCNSIASSLTRCTSIVSSLTRAVEHARTFAGAPRSVTRRKETRVARDFW